MKKTFLYRSLLVLGRGTGQVMFQNNALSGLLMLAGIFLNSWQMGVLAVSGNVISTLTARLSGYEREDIRNGLYGFNGTLVGVAAGVFMQPSLASWALMAIASCVSTWIARLFSLQRLLPGFTAPFILSVWLLLWGCSWLQPGLLLVSDGAVSLSCDMDGLQAFGQGIGQVMFQDSLLSGLLFLAGILVHSRIAAAYTLLGVLLPIPLAVVLGADAGTLNAGLMGYNGVLCAIALGGTTWRSCVWASCAVLLSVVLQMVGMEWGVTTLTAPFVLSVWLVMGAKRMFGK